MNNTYLVFNNTLMNEDAKAEVKRRKSSLAMELAINGMCDSVFSNAFRNYLRNKSEIDMKYAIPTDVPRIGFIEVAVYEKMLKCFDLKDKYRIPMKGLETVKVEEPTSAISSEELKTLNNNIIMLTKAIMVLADKMPATINTLVRPKAYLPNKEDK